MHRVTAADPLTMRDRLLEATYTCVARFGIGKTTVEDVVKASGVEPGDDLPPLPGRSRRAAAGNGRVGDRPLLHRARRPCAATPPTSPSCCREGLVFAHESLREHEVLRKMLDTEPERLLPLALDRVGEVAAVHRELPDAVPRARGASTAGLRDGVDIERARRLPRPRHPLAHRLARPLGPRRRRPGPRARPRRAPRRHRAVKRNTCIFS